jgi:lipopolysaccharide/colanic/teichoic acid biosynthesis glycosyltransferase
MRVPEKEVLGLVVGQAPRASVSSTRFQETPAARPEVCCNETAQSAGKLGTELSGDELPKDWPAWKRALDIGCIILALPILIPLVLVIAAVIFVVSPGPVLYLHPRVGYRGRLFICFKFRTMKVKAEVDTHRMYLKELMRSNQPMVKMDANGPKGDPRLIPLGGLLRSTGLDELPQLLNVLGGQMSLVGPRPCLPYEYENYLPEQKRRFETWPGLTGLWQVSGKNNTTFAEMIDLDLEYIRTQSFRTDIWIMLRTLPTLITQVRETRAQRLRQRQAQAEKATSSRSSQSPRSVVEVPGTEGAGRVRAAELARYR